MCLDVCPLFKYNHLRVVQDIKEIAQSNCCLVRVLKDMLKEPLTLDSVGERVSHTRSDAMLPFRRSTKPETETDKEGAKHNAPSIVLAVHYLGLG